MSVMKRDCIFLLADKNMQATFEGFLTRDHFNDSLGCGYFEFDSASDLRVASGDNDPGLFTRAHELLRPYQSTHAHAVVVLDNEWKGSPGATVISEHISTLIKSTGWNEEDFIVIVIDPELENWIWQRSPHVAKTLNYSNKEDLLSDPDLKLAWPDGQDKPTSPKEILEALLEKKKIPRSSAIYKGIMSAVSVKGCTDSSFHKLVERLRIWFPVDTDEVAE